MEKRFRIDNSALLKILLHEAKFSTSNVNGLLIGRSGEGEMSVTDAIPLFHTILSLSPQLEIALALTEERLKKEEDVIVGIYVADSHMAKADFDSATKTIGNKIASLNTHPTTMALIMDNEKLEAMMQEKDELPFKLYTRASSTGAADWNSEDVSDVAVSSPANLKSLFADMLDRKLHSQLHDFDEHLDNLKLDFWNEGLI